MNPYIPQDKFVNARGLRMHYLDWGGDTTKKPLILMHGIGGHAHAFDTFAPHFLDEYRVLALDGRGCGDTDWSKEGYSAQSYAADVAAFAQGIGAHPFDYFGHSQGSRLGMPLGAYYGNLVDHLVLGDHGPLPDTSPAGRQTAQDRLAGGARAERPRGFFSPQQAFDWHHQNEKEASDEEIWEIIKHTFRTNWDGILVPKTDPEVWWLIGRTALKEGPFLWDCVGKITCKTLVLRGEISTVLDYEQAVKMVANIPNGNATLKEVPGAGHGLYIEAMETTVQIIREFLAT